MTIMPSDIVARAETMTRQRDPLIEEQDRKPVAFCSSPVLDTALAFGTSERFSPPCAPWPTGIAVEGM